jgi:peptide chain release factor 1
MLGKFGKYSELYYKYTNLGTSLCESENVVNEEQHILAFLVTEIFGYCQTGQGNTGTSSWGLIHLTVHKGYL